MKFFAPQIGQLLGDILEIGLCHAATAQQFGLL
jgi:hypothetical protein